MLKNLAWCSLFTSTLMCTMAFLNGPRNGIAAFILIFMFPIWLSLSVLAKKRDKN